MSDFIGSFSVCLVSLQFLMDNEINIYFHQFTLGLGWPYLCPSTTSITIKLEQSLESNHGCIRSKRCGNGEVVRTWIQWMAPD